MEKDEIVGLDGGYSGTKVMTAAQSFMFPSAVGPARELSFTLPNSHDIAEETVTIDGATYFTGKKAEHCCDTMLYQLTRDWLKSVNYLALLHTALRRAIKFSQPNSEIFVVSGLPVDYMKDKETAEGQIRAVAKTLGIKLSGVKILPQPFGTFFDFILDENGEPTVTERIGMIGVIDIGQNTTDYILIRNLRDNIERANGSLTMGVFGIIDGVRRDLMQMFSRDNLRYAEVEACIRKSKSIRINGEDKDVSDVVNAHISNTAQSIMGEIKSRWSKEGDVDLILLTGGGCILLREELKKISHTVKIMPGAQRANARGYYKYGLLLRKGQGQYEQKG